MYLKEVYMADICPHEDSGEFLFSVLHVKVLFSSQSDLIIISL